MRLRNIGIGATLLIVAVVLMIAYVWKGDQGRSLAARLDSAQIENRALVDEQDRLRSEIITLSSVERIKRIATGRLGLVEPAETPIDVPAIAPIDQLDSTSIRATGLENIPARNGKSAR